MKKKLISFVIIALFTLNILTITPIATISSNDEPNLTFTFKFPEPKIIKNGACDGVHDKILIEGLTQTIETDSYQLPVHHIQILLPYDKTIKEARITNSEKILHNTLCNIQKNGKLFTITENTIQNKITDSINSLPTKPSVSTPIKINGVHTFRGYQILYLSLHPIEYNEETQEITSYSSMQITVQTKDASPAGGLRNLEQDKSLIQSRVINPELVSLYPEQPYQKTNLETAQYIIITDESFTNTQASATFEDLITSKQNKGMTAKIVTKQEILSDSTFDVNGPWGDNNPDNPFYQESVADDLQLFNDVQAKIRNYIRYAYTELQTEYVLLAGDADEIVPKDNLIPCRKLFADEEGLPLTGKLEYEKDDIPSDVYYACLDGNFNDDHDEHFGESKDFNDEAAVEEADLLAEIYVGRACVDSVQEMSNFVSKTLWYDENNEAYLNNMLFIGEYLGFPGISAYGGNYKDYVEEQVAFPERLTITKIYDRDEHWDFMGLYEVLNTGSYHLINHDGHGNHNHLMKASGEGIMYLTNENPFFIYSHSCLTGSFDNYDCYRGYQEFDCIAEVLTCESPYGAFACILNARYGLGSEDTLESPSGAYDESFYKALFEENIRELGRASHYSKEDHVGQIDENGMRWCYYQTNLFGDPALQIRLLNTAPETPTIEGNAQGKTNEIQEYTLQTDDPENDDVLYYVEWGDETNSGWIGPHPNNTPITATHTWANKGSYTIRVKAKDVFGEESDWQTLEVSMPKRSSYSYISSISKIIFSLYQQQII